MAAGAAQKTKDLQLGEKHGSEEKSFKMGPQDMLRLREFTEDFNREALLKLPQEFLQKLKEPFVGRDEEALVAALALITGEHVIFIGPPGTAKSAVAVRASKLIKAKYFEIHLDRHMEKEELLGGRNIEKLKLGEMARIMKNMLPEAEIAFIDEFFAGRGGVLVVLNPLLNERKIRDSGKIINTHILSVFGATNEIPDVDEKLDAVYARFLFRQYVGPVDFNKQDEMISKAQKGRQAKRIQRALAAMYANFVSKNLSDIDETDVVKWVAANKYDLLGLFLERGFNAEASRSAIESYLDTDVRSVMSVDQLKFLGQLLTEVDTSKIHEKMLLLFEKMRDKIKIDLYDRTKGMVPDAVKAMALLNYKRIIRNEGKIIAEEEDLLALQYIAPIQKEDFKKVRDFLANELNTTQKYVDTIAELAQNLQDSRGELKLKQIPDLIQLLNDLDTGKDNVGKLMAQSGSEIVVAAGKNFKKESDELRKEIIEEFKVHMEKQDWDTNPNDIATTKNLFHELRITLAPKFEQTAKASNDPEEIIRARSTRLQILDLLLFIKDKNEKTLKDREERLKQEEIKRQEELAKLARPEPDQSKGTTTQGQ